MNVQKRAASAVLVVALALSAGLAGCAPKSIPPTAQGTVVIVTEDEYSIDLSQAAFRAGTYTFEVHNGGGATHNLCITGPGLDGAETPNIAPDGTASITVTLQGGEYELFCATEDHKDAGMDARITVK